MEYFKSPMNYIGNKYKLLPQIMQLFPENIDILLDMFCGGLDISLNTECKQRICNDKENHIIDFYWYIQHLTGEEVHSQILNIVEKYKLDKENVEGYNQLRKDYNENNDSILFYSLIAHSFNHQIRYNSEGMFNMPFGKNRSCYNAALQSRLKDFVDRIDDTYTFSCKDFRDIDLSVLTKDSFVYVDPPYLITTATYNERNGWSEKDEKELLELLDSLNEKGIKFGLSNVLVQNDKRNEILIKWSEKYTVKHLNYNYGNSSYHKKDKSTTETDEVFILNY